MTTKINDSNSFDFEGKEHSEGILFVKAYPELHQAIMSNRLGVNKYAIAPDLLQNKEFELQELNTNDFKNTLGKISAVLDDILKYQDPNDPNKGKSPFTSEGLTKGFSLDEIEINLGVEAGAHFFVTAKGNAGLTLKYKRR